MKNFIENLEEKIRKNIQLSKIEVLDNTVKHKKPITMSEDCQKTWTLR